MTYVVRKLAIQTNRPFSNSQGCPGSSMKWRLMRANLFKCKLTCSHLVSSPTVRIRNWPIVKGPFATLAEV